MAALMLWGGEEPVLMFFFAFFATCGIYFFYFVIDWHTYHCYCSCHLGLINSVFNVFSF